jgi:lysyl-tRNA synthetase class 1
VLWGFIAKYAPQVNPADAKFLDGLVDYAVLYYNDFIKSKKVYLEPGEKHLAILQQISSYLAEASDDVSAEEIQNAIYGIGETSGYDNLRLFFSDLYQLMLGQSEGPRLGSFIKLYGIIDTKNLINHILEKNYKKNDKK